MVDHHDELEADFQQYYGLNFDKELEKDAMRTSRLFAQLPQGARTFIAIYPAAEWNWNKETQSRILAKLDYILVTLQNIFRDKKRGSAAKPDEQWQPDYVKEAKEEVVRQKRQKLSDEELEELKNYFRHRNDQARYLDDEGH